jgi:hypothetical protein
MSYFVVCTFDLKNATRTDYENAYNDLANMGLKKTVVAGNGMNVVAPTTTAMGEFTGTSSASVRDFVRTRVQAAFNGRRFKSEIFIVVGGDWTWGGATT